ncbi:M-phase phosphoprotein 6 [Irineochytrium annulatum]|nr:M-phase phosphoprotein 6 [Irineochytrium annulatum]
MNMKFMQRGKEAENRKKQEEEEKRTAREAEWVLDWDEIILPTQSHRFEQDHSYLAFTDEPAIGRMSFNGFNKEMETLAAKQTEEHKRRKVEENEARNSVSAVEMTRRYEAIGLPSNRAAPLKASPKEKRKRGQDDDEVAGGNGKARRDAINGKRRPPTPPEPTHGTFSRMRFLKPE